MTYDLPNELTVTADGPVRIVTINGEADLNSVDEKLHWALANVWRQLAADKDAKVVVLAGAGRAFSAGGDLGWITTFLDDPVARDESIRLAEQPVEALQGTKRVVNMYLSQVLSGPLQAGFAAEQVTMRSEDHRQRLLAFRKKTEK
ncbi:enoyl-CoA hydratase/isomerase family protein [Mycolicibacterium goodii]|uniref:Enoyl-CoA hydratase/isomerase family protein n=1 Tax=Mycolicibacterium goodii TaxID=134601 RepID=A0ABS6HX17_MYCGD|nr:enoyl-CoA hydratase/isomerase family protein [Mycolicibacterium goodii]MBU8819087.1 enoyl-CoA hydratase/isomerase family protein [Mycolicibacterium goodii]MBU8827219.1 enoyl-CoA hydratase/isomerase family protein [Mycolicibacterium goodii]MBU8836304.1 enoyl-CoA hydratase/isomerase family protein [Mycolicibacterium goodii]